MVKYIKDELAEKALVNMKLRQKAESKVWNFKATDFIIDNKTFNFTHPSWKGTWCKGGKTKLETMLLIKKYCKECKKQLQKRDLSFLHLVGD